MTREFAFDLGDELTKLVKVEHSGNSLTIDVRVAGQVVLESERFEIKAHGEIETEPHGVGLYVRYRAPLASWLPLMVWRHRWF